MNIDDLRSFGFQKIGYFQRHGKDLVLTYYTGMEDHRVGLYCMTHGEDVLYIGQTANHISSRVQQYCNPGKGQYTNTRINGEIMELGGAELWSWAPAQAMSIAGVEVNLCKGLEDGLIRKFHPEHNKR
jgi:hypothetical protein